MRKAPVLTPALQSKQSSLCVLHRNRDRGGGRPSDQIVSVKKAADGRRQRSREIIDEKREKYRTKNGSMRNTSTDSKRAAFVILINHASALIRKERLSPTSEARKKASQMSLWKRAGCQCMVSRSIRFFVIEIRPNIKKHLAVELTTNPTCFANVFEEQ